MLTRHRPFTFLTASLALKKRDKKKLGTATTLEKLSDTQIGIRYHNTVVIRYNADGSIQLNNGGWTTPTTKKRINDFTNARIHQKDFVWYITDSNGTKPFINGMKIDNNGEVLPGPISLQ
jgi:hypothetical protein